MKRLLLERFAYSPESTEGELFILDDETPLPKVHVCWTLELPWKQNVPSVSCIPEGSYWIAPHVRPDGRHSFIVWGNTVSQSAGGFPDSIPPRPIADRWGILFHSANLPHELKGCIAPGLDRRPGRVVRSKRAMVALRKACADTFKTHDRMVLTIKQKASEAT